MDEEPHRCCLLASEGDGRVSHADDEVAGLPKQLRESNAARTQLVKSKLKRAMSTIERELEEHENIYPYNRGRLNQAEVCRRAGVKKVTLQGKSHKTTTKVVVDDWLLKVKGPLTPSSKAVRRKVTDRADYWKGAHEAIAQQQHKIHIQLVQLKEELAAVSKERDELATKVRELTAAKVKLLKPSTTS